MTTAILVVIVLAVTLELGYSLSRDRDAAHSTATLQLPLLVPGTAPGDGLVRIATEAGEFRARVAGIDSGGDAVILLHGFPQSSACWQPVITALAAAGYRVAAPDMRGYSPGARPSGVCAYGVHNLVGDVLGIADRLGFGRFHLVGHDWGAAVGWATALSSPDRLLSWTALSIGHPVAFRRALKQDADQKKRSSYFLLFRLPWLPERVLGWGRQQVLRKVMYHVMPAEAVAEYQALFSEPGALTSVLNYYRAMGDGRPPRKDPGVDTPTLFLWGNRDPAAGRAAAEATADYMGARYRFVELDAGHWLVDTRGEAVIAELLDHLSAATADAES